MLAEDTKNGFVYGVQHDTCPLEMREALACIDADKVAEHLRQVGVQETMVLSTCNRFEVYGYSGDGVYYGASLPLVLGSLAGISAVDLQNFTYHKEQEEMVLHGFGVAASVHSMVVGEPQILGQMKKAWKASKQAGHSGVFLNRFASSALRVGKRVRTETTIASEAVSVASVAVRLAQDIYADLSGASVLLLGAGEMSEQAAKSLKSAGVRDVVIMNHRLPRAEKLAAQFDANVIPFSQLPEALRRADIVLTSTASRHYLITEDMAKKALQQRKQEPILFVDMAIPRDVDPLVHQLENCYVYDVDSLGQLAQKARQKRHKAIGDAEKIIQEEAGFFMSWYNTRRQASLIKALRTHFYNVRTQVLERGFKDPEEATRLLVNKLLHEPSHVLRNKALLPKQLEGLETLFPLDKPQKDK